MTTTDGTRIAQLYATHADAAIRLAFLLTGDAALAEDLVQDAFVRLAGRLAHLRDPSAFNGYLRRTVVNLARSHFRRRRVERGYLERARADAARASTLAPDASVENRDELWAALGHLSTRQRAAVVLRFYEDMSEADVADVLSCAPGTVKSLVARGLERLRAEIGDEDR